MRQRFGALGALVAVVVALATVPGSTAPGDPVLRLTAAGDFGATTNSSAVFDTIRTIGPDLHLALGDMSYGVTGQEQAWCDFVTSRVGAGFPFELVSGNHESNGQNGNINDFSACLPNQLPGAVGTYGRQYYVDVPKGAPLARFVLISPGIPFSDGTWSYAVGSARYAWTADVIDDARSDGIPWVIVGMHTPCIAVGDHACDSGADIYNLLLAKRVDLVLTGHEHLYQRSKQLALRTGCTGLVPTTYNASCVADSDSELVKGAGTVIATAGTGGIALRNVHTDDPELPYFAATSGANQNPTWGVLDVSLTPDVLSARFARASGGTFSDSFTITRDTSPNTAPTASFTSSCSALTCGFDGSGSTDTDGTVQSFAWTFGDGTTGNGQTPTHTYGAAGTYTVSLTVTDDDGATGTTSNTVTVTSPPGGTTVAADDFSRTVSNGWGTAPTGGPWTLGGTSSSFSVSSGVGRISLAAGTGRSAYLNGVSTNSVDVRLVLSSDKVANGNGLYTSVIARRVAGQGEYRAKLQIAPTGAVRVSIVRTNASGAETTIGAQQTVSGLTYAVGSRLNVRTETTGTSPTQIRVKVWAVGATEPAGWLVSATDTTTGLQAPGSIGLFTYLSGTATNGPVVTLVDDLVATNP